MTRSTVKLLAALALSALLSACATAPAPAPVAAAPPPPPPVAQAQPAAPAVVAPVRERIRRAVDLLGRGQRDAARIEVVAVLAEQPANTVGKSLLDQIDRDPRALLGERNYPYKIRAGESLSSLAGRFLGDPLMFYALARYNGIEAPDTAEVGRTLLIPGAPKKATAAPRAATAASAPPATGANPARANALRRQALEHLNKGTVDSAVALLRQAAPLDPANPAIRSDLDRALRIQASVKRR